MTYNAVSLSSGILFQGEDVHFKSFEVPHQGGHVAAGVWSDSSSLLQPHKTCILYVHTNTRSLADAASKYTNKSNDNTNTIVN